MTFEEWMERVVHGFEIVGVAILVAGSIAALAGYVIAVARGRREGAFERVRQAIGRAILLGLEVLIIADIVRTIIVDPTLESVAVLGAIVVIRILLSFSLEVEIDGAWPWRRAERSTTRTDC